MWRRTPAAQTDPQAATASASAPPGAIAAEPDPEPVGTPGYRVIRTLGVGARSRVYLALAEDSQAPVALKAFEPAVCDDSIETEVAACETAQSLHVVRLLDLSFGSRVPRCIVLERLDGGTVAALLRVREHIRTGEAVTILVSVLRGIRALHRAGFGHGAVSASNVLFDRTGRPVLIGLGHAVRLARPGTDEFRADVRRDWERYRTFAQTVLDRVDGESRANELAHLARMIDDLACGRGGDIAEKFETALFRLDQPAPVRLARVGDMPASQRVFGPSSRRLRTATGMTAGTAESNPGPEPVGPGLAGPGLAAPGSQAQGSRGNLLPGGRWDRFARRAEEVWDAGPLRAVARRCTPFAAAHKKPLIVAGAIAGAIAIAGLAVIPPGHRTAYPTATSPAFTAAPRPAQHAASGGGAPTPDPSWSPPPTAAVVVGADDPVDAVTVLLAERARCFAQAAAACLNAVDQADSAQLEKDRAAVQSRAGAAARESLIDYSKFAASLIQRTGDSALVELTPPNPQSRPASALVIKGEAGWRLRQIFEN